MKRMRLGACDVSSHQSQIVVGWAESAKPSIPSEQKKELGLLSPTAGPTCAPQELWLAAHLPHLPVQARGQKILERLATGAQRFTPRVSLAPPDGLLLEVKGSLNLFGGVSGLRLAVAQLHRSAGVEAILALAPTPLAALVRARANQ